MLLFPMLLLLLNVPTKNFSEKMVCSIEPQTNNITHSLAVDFKVHLTDLKQNIPDYLIYITALPDGGGGLCGGAGRAGGAMGRGGGGRLGSKLWEDSFCWVPSWNSAEEHDRKQCKN